MSSSDFDIKLKDINLYDINNTIKATYLLHKCQLNIEIKKLETMIKDTEKQKEVDTILNNSKESSTPTPKATNTVENPKQNRRIPERKLNKQKQTKTKKERKKGS